MWDISITFDEFIYCAIIALVLTWIVNNAVKLHHLLKQTASEFGYQPRDITQIMQRCYALFPRDIVQFKGKTLRRGMKIQIITMQQKIFEGEFIGSNNRDMLCILTTKYIVAHEITNISEIKLLDN